MTDDSNKAIRQIAMRVYQNALRASTEDSRKLARAVLLLIDGKLPR